MSRTFRRKGDKKRNKSGRSHFEKDYVNDCYDDRSINGWGGLVHYTLTGKAFDKAFWKFHGDSSNAYGWSNPIGSRKAFEAECRMNNKQEIARYLKDDEYEIQVYYPSCLSWER